MLAVIPLFLEPVKNNDSTCYNSSSNTISSSTLKQAQNLKGYARLSNLLQLLTQSNAELLCHSAKIKYLNETIPLPQNPDIAF